MRRPARTGLLTICDRDLGDFGFTLARAPNLVGTMSMSHPTGVLAGLAGQLPYSRDAVLDPTILPLEVSFAGDARSELMPAFDALNHWCSLGPVEISSSFDWSRVILAAYNGPSLDVPGKQFREPTWKGTLAFTRRVPFAYDRYPRRAVTNGAGPSNRVEIETGTAPSHAVLWLVDSTVATITQRAADGTIVRQTTITTVQGPNDAMILDGARSRLIGYLGGIRAEMPTAMTLGHFLVRLEPRFAHYEAQRWQTLETSSGRLVVDWVRGWLR